MRSWRTECLRLGTSLSVVLIALPVALYDIVLRRSGAPWLFLIVLLVATLISQLLLFRRMVALRRGLRAGDGRFCLGCGYHLDDLGDSGRCPECGTEFDITKVRRKWNLIARFE
jgi:hypothetical protein